MKSAYRLTVIALMASLTLACGGEGVTSNPAPINTEPTEASTAHKPCIPGQQIACPCLGGGEGVQACNKDGESYGACQCPANDAGNGAETDVPLAKKTCTLMKDVDWGPGDTTISSAANQDGFAVSLCQTGGDCDLIIMGKNEGPVTMAKIGGGEYGFLVYGAKHGYLVSYVAMTDAGQKFRTAYIDGSGFSLLEGEISSGFVYAMAMSMDGGYWFGVNDFGELLPEGSVSSAGIRYMSPLGVTGNTITFSQTTKPTLAQNQVVGLATIGQTVAAAVHTSTDDGKQNTAVFLVQPDGTIVKVVLDTYVSGYSQSEVHSAPGYINAFGNRFAFQWSMMSDPYWKNYLTYMDTDGSNLETIELPYELSFSSVGDAWAGVENDQTNLKIRLTLFDEQMRPISDPLVVADGVKTYYMSYPVARGVSSQEIMIAYTSETLDKTYHIRAAFVDCK